MSSHKPLHELEQQQQQKDSEEEKKIEFVTKYLTKEGKTKTLCTVLVQF